MRISAELTPSENICTDYLAVALTGKAILGKTSLISNNTGLNKITNYMAVRQIQRKKEENCLTSTKVMFQMLLWET